MEKIDEAHEYGVIIREMIKHENEIRNQRTNWFLVIQGFLIAGISQLANVSYLHLLIAVVGIVSSLSFKHAAWRSTLAITFALACWRERFNSKQRVKLPPVSLICKKILDIEESPKNKQSWELRILKQMYNNREDELQRDKKKNQRDYLLPYRALPVLFLLFWCIYFIGNYKLVLQLIDEVYKLCIIT